MPRHRLKYKSVVSICIYTIIIVMIYKQQLTHNQEIIRVINPAQYYIWYAHFVVFVREFVTH